MSQTSIESEIRTAESEIVYAGYTRAQLSAAFSAVQNRENWKYPIDAIINKSDKDVTTAAIVFFAGCLPEYYDGSGDRTRVQAVGYYVAIGA